MYLKKLKNISHVHRSQPRNQDFKWALWCPGVFYAWEQCTEIRPQLVGVVPLRRAMMHWKVGKENLPSCPWHVCREISFRKEYPWKLRT